MCVREDEVSFPIELLFGYGLVAVICDRCGKAVVTPGSRLCPGCEDEPAEAPSDTPEDLEDDA